MILAGDGKHGKQPFYLEWNDTLPKQEKTLVYVIITCLIFLVLLFLLVSDRPGTKTVFSGA